jgi:AcrR family transcriptional regulator
VPENPTSRPYHSPLREEQAERTRSLSAQAARTRFLESGWARTSVRSVASAAGVSEATVYAVYGSKAGLASSLIDEGDARAGVAQVMAELEAGAGDPAAQLRAFVGYDRRLFERHGDVLRVLVEGRRQEPDLQAAYVEGRGRGDAQRRSVFETWPKRAWRRGVDLQHGLDAYSFTCSMEAFDIATGERGWTPDEVERWWGDTLVERLLS